MAIINIQLTFDNMNVSAQVGDIVYYSYGGNPIGGFDQTALVNTRRLGPIKVINGNQITVEYDNDPDGIPNSGDELLPPPGGSYISFVKDKKVNTTSMLGYYISANFVNNSRDKIELFSVGSEIVESSK
jgi:hypothetical protein